MLAPLFQTLVLIAQGIPIGKLNYQCSFVYCKPSSLFLVRIVAVIIIIINVIVTDTIIMIILITVSSLSMIIIIIDYRHWNPEFNRVEPIHLGSLLR